MAPSWSYDDFRQRLTPRGYHQFEPYLERMKQGEADVLWPGGCRYFARSAGTTGEAKVVPVTPALLTHLHLSAREVLLNYAVRVGHTRIFQGRHLLLGGCTALTPLSGDRGQGDLTAVAAQDLSGRVHRHYYEPGAAVGNLPDGEEKWRQLTARARQAELSLIAGAPHNLLALAEQLPPADAARPTRSAWPSWWPRLECIVHGATALTPYVDELRQLVGPRTRFHEVYAAAEGCLAVQDSDSPGELRLLTGTGLFYEFVPFADYHPARLHSLGAKAVPLEGVQPGQDYVMLLTTPAGLCRYVLGDVVRFLSQDPPRLRLVGRVDLQLSSAGEVLHESDVTQALVAICQRQAWRIVNFHVAPLLLAPTGSAPRRHHEWWVELKPGTMATPTGPTMAVELDQELQSYNESYRSHRRCGALQVPLVRLVMPGLFEQWLREKGRWGINQKVPRCRSDRHVADELARLAPFSAH